MLNEPSAIWWIQVLLIFGKYAIAIVLVEAITEGLVESKLITKARGWAQHLATQQKWIDAGVEEETEELTEKFSSKLRRWIFWFPYHVSSCAFCASFHFSYIAAICFELGIGMGWNRWIEYSLAGIVVHRLANWWHDTVVMPRWIVHACAQIVSRR